MAVCLIIHCFLPGSGALPTAGTDDPILAVFGFTIVRSNGITEKSIEKYTAALTSLGASGADATQYQNATTTLASSMVALVRVT